MNSQILMPIFPYYLNVILPYNMVYYAYGMHNQLRKSDISIKQEENKESITKEEFIESSKQEECNLKIEITEMSSYYQIFPGQTKNYYKNIGQKINKFIESEFSEFSQIKQDKIIQKFLRIDKQKYNRDSIQKLMKSKKGRRICKLFFAQFKWVIPFVSQNKTDLDLYFRYNRILCVKKQREQKKRNEFQIPEKL
ncbi:unnamed protein product [Paramecium sonneborni]|uniref:Transmembrane protein n=1 Tax=Paramecium sonneborni TaxID=65129 RepID=A0A8S1LCB2_9CILI|nr:unnamed protein product [Paramecium sonneborni]